MLSVYSILLLSSIVWRTESGTYCRFSSF
uniref:Uncharacterized protein n=1 Tax=Anguilla anguilla TaxID=7936 RepID=A0A0E9XCI2_ANGAN